ncbi:MULTISPECIES: glycoside hydrolase family 31 protein [Niastella]|uniref:DUF4968 domain-containing protein n=1 Tax=Niastella soli TaxID=2821487 RepID=A0ABS3Z2A3_9BACT|nr:TIM-barrel domain-containing protein [Niastella soli]MBO9204278.1 DUF4968 domain-containing protein [Niastella soli]
MKKYLFVIGLLFTGRSFGQVHSAGNVTSVKVKGPQLMLTMQHAVGEITVYSPTIVRVRLDQHSLGRDFSYAVVNGPVATHVDVNQTPEAITLLTDSLKVIIARKPFHVAFFTRDGRVINEDEQGLNTSWVNSFVTTYKHLQEGERFIGLGEKVGGLDKRGNGYTNWNSDNFGYRTDKDPLYATFPFYIGIHHGLRYGIFLDNSWQTDFNFGASTDRFSSFGAHGGEMNYYFIAGARIDDIITSYTGLTGRMKLPPLWSLGYQQNRYSYYPETEVMRIAQTLREKKIPADGITLDIHYMDKYKVFTWDKQRFPDPAAMSAKLADMGFKLTVIVDPGVKREEGYGVYERGKKEGAFIKYPDSTDYIGQVWPGWCAFPDFTGVKGRAWWEKEISKYASDGVSGIWNDMNEISTWGQKMPDNVLFNNEGEPATHLQMHNVYGLNMARSSFEGFKQALNRRPFILSRSGYAGLQRYSAIWTGDNRAEEDHMLLGVRLLCNLGLAGIPFTGMDVGGFTGGPSVGLYVRWMQIGSFNPYMRNHTGVNTKSSEPWSYGEQATEIVRNYISLRYRLLPYAYSNFYEATQNGLPLMRTLALDYTDDAAIYRSAFENQFMYGRAFMVAPFTGSEGFGNIYFPAGNWFDLYTDQVIKGGQELVSPLTMSKLPVYVKAGSIVPMQSLVQHTAEKPTDTLLLHVYAGDQGSDFVYYEDDGFSYNYEKGDFFRRRITYDPVLRQIILGKVEGQYASKFKFIKLALHGFGDGKLTVGGQAAGSEFEALLTPVSKFDPQGEANAPEGHTIRTVTVRNTSQEAILKY